MPDPRNAPPAGDRLAKVMARSGLCSRRDAELWIAAGRVSVNGRKVQTPAFNVSERDAIEVDGKPLAQRQGTRVWLYHKPAGLVVTEKDPEGRPTIFEAVAEHGLPRVVTVGRLDINTEGLLLLTNDGGLKRVLELPSTGWLRRYRVRAHGSVTQEALDRLRDGMTVDGITYGPIEAVLEREQGANVWLVLALREGKNREVKNVLEALGLLVNRLIRVSYGPFQLGDLPVGGIETVKARVLRDQLGERLAAEAGVDFEAEMPELSRPAPQRPGHGGPPPRARAPRREAAPGPTRRIHFEDGRPPAEFIAKGYGRKRASDDVAPRGERPARGDRPARSDRSTGADREPRRDSGARGERADRPQRAARTPGRAERPVRSDKPVRMGRPAGSERPARADRPARSERPGSVERPARADRPFRTDRPAGERPQRSGAPKGKRFEGNDGKSRAGARPASSGGKPRTGGAPGAGRPRTGGPGSPGSRPRSGGRPAPTGSPRKPRS